MPNSLIFPFYVQIEVSLQPLLHLSLNLVAHFYDISWCLQSFRGFIALSQKIKGGNQAARLSPAAASCSLSSRV